MGLYLNWYEGYTGHYLPAGWDVLWSLSIEEVFYIGFPVACLLLRREWLLSSFLVVLALSLPWTRAAALAINEVWHAKAYLPGMAAIATGVLTALLATKFHPKRWTSVLIVVGSLGIGATLFADDILWRAFHEGLLLVLALSSACLLLAFRRPGRPDARRNTAPSSHRQSASFIVRGLDRRRRRLSSPKRLLGEIRDQCIGYDLMRTKRVLIAGFTRVTFAWNRILHFGKDRVNSCT